MGRWPLIGRDRDLAAGASALRRGRSVVVAGPVGTGRTRLARELLARAAQAGRATLTVTATAAARTVPLGALAPVLPGVGPGPEVFPRAIEAIGPPPGRAARVAMIDDAHLLDEASAALIHQLVAHQALTVVATMVTGRPAPDAVVALWKDGHAERIDLAPLDPKAISALIDEALPGGIDGVTMRALIETTAGSPMTLQHLLHDGVPHRAPDDVAGQWSRAAPWPVSARAADLVGASLAEVKRAGREVLELLAIGGPLGVALLERLAPPEQLEALEASALLVVARRGVRVEADLVPGLCRPVLLAQLPPLRHRRLAGELARAVGSCGARRSDDLRKVVVWCLDSGREVEPDRLLAAARDAHRALDFDLALRLARAAWASTRTAEVGHVLGHVLWLAGHHTEADEVLGEALRQAHDDEAIVHVTNTLASNRLRGLHDTVGAVAAFEGSARRVRSVRCRAALDAHRAASEVLQGLVADALARAEPYLDPADPWLFAEAAVAAAPALALNGRPSAGAALAESAFTVHSELPLRPFAADDAGIHLVTLAMARLHSGLLSTGEKLAEAAYRASLTANSVNGRAWFSLLLGNSAQWAGRVRTSERWYAESAAAFGRLGDAGLRRVALAGIALSAAQSGAQDRAHAALDQVDGCGEVAVRLYDTVLAQARAWVAAGDGDQSGARSLLMAAAVADLAHGRLALAVHAAHDLARLGETSAARELAGDAHRRKTEGELLPALLDHIEARATAEPVALEEIGTRFEAMGALLLAAEATAAAAAARRKRGEDRRGAALDRRAVKLAGTCEGAVTPALLRIGAPSSRLTPREAEVARLAAGGLSNGHIAGRLGVSIRTVENHLGRAYAKLGVASRLDLDDALSGDLRSIE